mgnify:CR=1 FL=1|tara:strand:- start:319 stop:996 length:678 start_codon:yes stop_codon:yes gene_type:complete
MGSFGWAYIDCAGSSHETGSANGPLKSVQYCIGDGDSSGSLHFTYRDTPNTLFLTGTLVVSGAISASSYHIKNVVHMDVSGSTYFGNTNDDVHVRTGSFSVGRAAAGNTILKVDQATLTTKVYGFASRYRKITGGTGTISVGDYIISCSGSGNQTIQLPSGSACLAGTQLLIKDEAFNRSASGKIYISASNHVAGYNIENRKFYVMVGTMPAINLYTDGTNWFVY